MMAHDLTVFAAMAACGAAMALLFDILRSIRYEFKPNTVIVAISDVIFCAACALCAAACVWNLNDGRVRMYEAAALICGAALYFLLLSRWTMRVLLLTVKNIRRLFQFIFKILLTPPRFLYKILKVRVNLISMRSSKRNGSKVHKHDS